MAGTCDSRFERVHEAFASNIDAGKEVGASLYVNIDGEDVVDLWGGWRDRERTSPWTEDTIVNVFSASKTVTSLAVLTLVDRGEIDVFAPVAEYWPEFAANGKEGVQVRHLMGHTSGVAAWEQPFRFEDALDMRAAAARLAAQAPWWEPGTAAAYHASTFGHLLAELVLRVSGKTLGEFVATELAGPLDADFSLGVDDADFPRVATVYPAPEDGRTPQSTEDTLGARIRAGSFSGTIGEPLAVFNSPEWRRTEFGGSSGHGNARGIGRIVSAIGLGGVSRGVKLVSPETIELIFDEQANGVDGYYRKPIRWGIGYALSSPAGNERGPLPFLRPDEKTCFWYGTGGSMAIVDVERHITIAYAMNQCQSGKDSLNGVYYKLIYQSLGIS